MGFYLVPIASEGFNNFRYTYLRTGGQQLMQGDNTDVYRQISDTEFIYVNSFNTETKTAYNFSLENFEKEKLTYKITAARIQWNPKEKNYTLFEYTKRTVGPMGDKIEKVPEKKMKFKFEMSDAWGDDYTIVNTQADYMAYDPHKLSMEKVESAFTPEDRMGALELQNLSVFDGRNLLIHQLSSLGRLEAREERTVAALLGVEDKK
jgi:lipopolysaccharide export LptBFGC system permease protein LptF